MFAEQPRPARLTEVSKLLLDGVDSPLQAVDLGDVAQFREEVLEPLQVVVEAAPTGPDDRDL